MTASHGQAAMRRQTQSHRQGVGAESTLCGQREAIDADEHPIAPGWPNTSHQFQAHHNKHRDELI